MRGSIVFWLSLALLNVHLFAGIYEDDVLNFIRIFKTGSNDEKKEACESLQWEGISDTRVYDLVLADLKKRIKPDEKYETKQENDQVAWLVRALACSGNDVYKEELAKISKAELLRSLVNKHIEKSQPMFEFYAKWNPIIFGDKIQFEQLSGSENRTINMLKSKELELVRLGAKKIFHEHIDTPEVLDVAVETLRSELSDAQQSEDSLTVDTMSWLLKAIAISAEPKYEIVFEEVIKAYEQKKVHRKVASYAKKYKKHFN